MTIKNEVLRFMQEVSNPVSASWIAHNLGLYYHQAKQALDELEKEGKVTSQALAYKNQRRVLYSLNQGG